MRRVQMMRESLKERLKHCKTKQEAQAVITQAMAGVSKKDPAKQAMFAMIGNIQKQFMSSDAYNKLPNSEKELKNKKSSIQKSSKNPFKEDEEVDKEDNEDGDSSDTGDIQYSVTSGGYQEATIPDAAGAVEFEAGA